MQAAQAEASTARTLAAQREEEAAQAAKRVADVESEMRRLLTGMERQKKASAVKVQQLASVVSDLQRPFLSYQPQLQGL